MLRARAGSLALSTSISLAWKQASSSLALRARSTISVCGWHGILIIKMPNLSNVTLIKIRITQEGLFHCSYNISLGTYGYTYSPMLDLLVSEISTSH